MRIQFPLDYQGNRSVGLGWNFPFKVKGDFEITIRFEILKEPDPTLVKGMGTRATLGVNLETTEIHEAAVSHKMYGKDAIFFTTWLNSPAIKTDIQKFPAKNKAKAGRLRLVRTGSTIACLAAEGTSNEFTLLKEFPFDNADVRLAVLLHRDGQPPSRVGGPHFRSSASVRTSSARVNAATCLPSQPGAGNVALALGLVRAHGRSRRNRESCAYKLKSKRKKLQRVTCRRLTVANRSSIAPPATPPDAPPCVP